ncbi:SPOR domain-containing protein [Vibrio sagamiensis]|uniref:Cell division protein DamX n=1 Tax=Vibrio sagamiensis NBRC 104589 TaxID=1219064 RepID=A0A511QHD0_9VIBR|nr:SPOR domain-containing protein [Vibrio sagamiensis]PNQ71329.1 cell division protein DamX [Vibrio agarivorans]GEM76708.1 cell division protein DamX [Vibrio sagamiensis NBRC 104589]
MSFAHVLELDSQTGLLERLGLLTNFGSNLIVINGQTGYGKSWLAQRYLEVGASNKNQCLLSCHVNQDDSQRRMLMLSQIMSDALFDQHDTLIDSLEHIVGNDECDIAIVIDDANLLSESLVLELWALVLAAQIQPNWRINILLFTKTGHFESILARISYGQDLKPVELDIDLLSEIEARRFFESLVVRYVDDSAEKRVRNAFKKVSPTPGDIMALGEMKMEKRIIIRSIIDSPLNIALLVLLLLLLIASGYWWMQPDPDDKAQQITRYLEQTAIPTITDPAVSSDSAESMQSMDMKTAENSVNTPKGAAQVGEDDSNALPPVVTDNVISVGNEDNQQRVVIDSEVVDALLEDKSDSSPGNEPDKTNNLDSTEQNDPKKAPHHSSSSLINIVPKAEVATNKVASVTAMGTFSYALDALKALPARSYTLQLGAMTDKRDVQAFLDKHNLNDEVRIYPTLRNDKEWFIITYQDYPTIQAARDAADALPEVLKLVNPWAKSISQVHKEIDQAK